MTPPEPTLTPSRALKALRQQLNALQELKNRSHEEAKLAETEWKNFTQNIIEEAFGNPSTQMDQFYTARSAGDYTLLDSYNDGIDLQDPPQASFESRIQAYEALLRSLIKTLKLRLPEEEIKGVYEPGDEYAFYRDLSSLVEAVAKRYAKSRHLELRSSEGFHDRMVFLNQRGWVIGQSVKDAAKKKPTYLIELTEPLLTAAREAHDKIWEAAKPII